ncbi:MAG: thiolase domain-containing protein [Candidatus Babeliales bacterium]|jgi:acetyl-CoA C-acetyltransferase
MKIAVLGSFSTRYGELWDTRFTDLLAQASCGAIADAKIKSTDIDYIVTSSMCSGSLSGQLNIGALAADILHLNIPSVHVEGACASGALALHTGIAMLESGKADVVLVNGVEKMTDSPAATTIQSLMAAASYESEYSVGATFPALFAMVTRAYMHHHGTTRQDLAHVSIKNHFHASMNSLAHFRKKISLADVINAPMVADPLSILDCSPVSDGAASLIIATPEFAKKINTNPVYIIASTLATDTLALADRESIITCKATHIAARKAFAMAGLTPNEVNVVEVHDAFSMGEIIALEDCGFFQPGKAAQATVEGLTYFNAQLPVNCSGGLKAKGHPVGASGVGQAVEIVRQLQGQCEQRQVKNASVGLTHSMGGIGATVGVHIFSRE